MDVNDIIQSILQQREYMTMVTGKSPNSIIMGSEIAQLVVDYIVGRHFPVDMCNQAENVMLLGMKLLVDTNNPKTLEMGYMEDVPIYKFKED